MNALSPFHRHHRARRPSDLHDRSGHPAWALLGMLRQILEAIDAFPSDAVLLGLYDRKTSDREECYPGFQAGRAPKDLDLVDQLDRAGSHLNALGLAILTPPGLKADDVRPGAVHSLFAMYGVRAANHLEFAAVRATPATTSPRVSGIGERTARLS